MAIIQLSSNRSASTAPATNSLSGLIATLMGQVNNPSVDPDRGAAIDQQQQTQADYGKDNAFTDAQALMNNAIQNVLAERMPQLTLAAEGAGASGSSMRALLLGNIMNEAATEASALGAQQAVDYGQINNQAGAVLEQLTASDPAALNALIDAMRLRADINNQNRQNAAQERPRNNTSQAPSNQNRTIRSSTRSGNSLNNGLATASFLPTTPAPSTSGFFGREGGIADNSGGGMVSYGPAANYNPSEVLSRIQNGLTPMQSWEGVPGASNLYDTGLKF